MVPISNLKCLGKHLLADCFAAKVKDCEPEVVATLFLYCEKNGGWKNSTVLMFYKLAAIPFPGEKTPKTTR